MAFDPLFPVKIFTSVALSTAVFTRGVTGSVNAIDRAFHSNQESEIPEEVLDNNKEKPTDPIKEPHEAEIAYIPYGTVGTMDIPEHPEPASHPKPEPQASAPPAQNVTSNQQKPAKSPVPSKPTAPNSTPHLAPTPQIAPAPAPRPEEDDSMDTQNSIFFNSADYGGDMLQAGNACHAELSKHSGGSCYPVGNSGYKLFYY